MTSLDDHFNRRSLQSRLQVLLDIAATTHVVGPDLWKGDVALLQFTVDHTQLGGVLAELARNGRSSPESFTKDAVDFSAKLFLHLLRLAANCGVSAAALLDRFEKMEREQVMQVLDEFAKQRKL